MEGYFIAQICYFAGNFAPIGHAFCQGQLMVIDDNTALFSLIGTTYGGNGQTTFALPDFRGRIPVGAGQGPGLTAITLGEAAGSPQLTLTTANMPAHIHAATATVGATGSSANTNVPNGNTLATTNTNNFGAVAAADTSLGGVSATVQPAGSSMPVGLEMPYLGMNFIITIEGLFPSQN